MDVTGVGFAAVAIVEGNVSISTGTAVWSEGVAAELRAGLLLDALVDVAAQMTVLGVDLESGIAEAFVTDWLVDADVGARVHWSALVHVCRFVQRKTDIIVTFTFAADRWSNQWLEIKDVEIDRWNSNVELDIAICADNWHVNKSNDSLNGFVRA